MDRNVGHRTITDLKRGLRGLVREGCRSGHILNGTDDVEVRRVPL